MSEAPSKPRTGCSTPSPARMVAVQAAICLVPLCGVTAFAIDGGMLLEYRRRAQFDGRRVGPRRRRRPVREFLDQPRPRSPGTAASYRLADRLVQWVLEESRPSRSTSRPNPGRTPGRRGMPRSSSSTTCPRLQLDFRLGRAADPGPERRSRAGFRDQRRVSARPVRPGVADRVRQRLHQRGHRQRHRRFQQNQGRDPLGDRVGDRREDQHHRQLRDQWQTASLSGTVSTGATATADPLASIAEPSMSSLTTQSSSQYKLSGSSSATLNPGVCTGGSR